MLSIRAISADDSAIEERLNLSASVISDEGADPREAAAEAFAKARWTKLSEAKRDEQKMRSLIALLMLILVTIGSTWFGSLFGTIGAVAGFFWGALWGCLTARAVAS